jgi:hypothetical protein
MLKSFAIFVTGRGGPKDCEMSRLQNCLDNRLTEGGEVVSLTRLPHFALPPFHPKEDSWNDFC